MNDKTILLVADEKFLPHTKHVMVNARREGKWGGDFALLVTEETDTSEFENRGIDIHRVQSSGFLTKFHIFAEYYRKWSTVLYLDCDVIILSDLAPLVKQLDDYELLPNGDKPIIADAEDGPAWMSFERAAHGLPSARHTTFMALVREYQSVLEQFWNTSILLFDPHSIPDGTPKRLQAIQDKYQLINNQDEEGTDQQIIHVALYDRIRKVKRKLFCFWGLDENNARVVSETRGWDGTEVPIILHYARWYAPWVEKKADMDAYANNRLNRVCHEFYRENTQAFEEEFSR